jgi:hypothetical protein
MDEEITHPNTTKFFEMKENVVYNISQQLL